MHCPRPAVQLLFACLTVYRADAAAQAAPAGPRALPVAIPVDPERLPYARPGTMASLSDGRQIHLTCMGTGSPTVILTAGMGDWSVAWRRIQPAVARSTRVCAWDRAGFGFSDGSSAVQLIASTTNDLEEALKSANVAPPYVMVGHSMGGLESVLFTDRHREQVAGMVLVDPSVPNQEARLRRAAPAMAAAITNMRSATMATLRKCAAAVASGAVKPGSPDPDGCLVSPKSAPHETAAALAQRDLAPTRWAAGISLRDNFNSSAASLTNPARNYGALPLIVLTAGKKLSPPPDLSPADTEALRTGYSAFAAEINRAHDDLAALSTRGVNRAIADASHYIQYDRPDAVIAAIEEVLAQSRQGK